MQPDAAAVTDDQVTERTAGPSDPGPAGPTGEQTAQPVGGYAGCPAIYRPEFQGASNVFDDGYVDLLKTPDFAPPIGANPLRSDLRKVTTASDFARWMYKGRLNYVNLGRAAVGLPPGEIMEGLDHKLAAPNEAVGFLENAEAGLRIATAHIASNVISLAYGMNKQNLSNEIGASLPSRLDVYNAVYLSMASALNIYDLTVPRDFGDALVRAGFEGAGQLLLETLPLSVATGGVVNPLWTGLATKFPALAGKIAPIVNNALTFGVQGALEPDQPGKQAVSGAVTGGALGALSPCGRAARLLTAAGIGAGQTFSKIRRPCFRVTCATLPSWQRLQALARHTG